MKRLMVATALMLAACSSDSSASTTTSSQISDTSVPPGSGEEVVVEITGFVYPTDIEVPEGATVRWVNTTAATHSILFEEPNIGRITQPDLDLPGNGEVTATLPNGSWSYICGIHRYMSGTVLVG